MIVYTLELRREILRHYFENYDNVAECVRNCVWILKEEKHRQLCMFVILWKKKVKETGILIDNTKREKPKTVCTPENVVTVAESVREAPSTSINRRSQQLNISET